MKRIAIIGPFIESGLLGLGLQAEGQIDIYELCHCEKKIFIFGEELSWIDPYYLLPLWSPSSSTLDSIALHLLCYRSKFTLPFFKYWWDSELNYIFNLQQRWIVDSIFKWNLDFQDRKIGIDKNEMDLKILLNGSILIKNLTDELKKCINIFKIQQHQAIEDLCIEKLMIGDVQYDLILYIEPVTSIIKTTILSDINLQDKKCFFYGGLRDQYVFLRFDYDDLRKNIELKDCYPLLKNYPGISFFKMTLPVRCDLSYLGDILLSLKSKIYSLD